MKKFHTTYIFYIRRKIKIKKINLQQIFKYIRYKDIICREFFVSKLTYKYEKNFN